MSRFSAEIPVPDPQPALDMRDAFLAIAEALKTIKAGDVGASDKLASIEKFLLSREHDEQFQRPRENVQPPMVSAYNPLGERDHPRQELRCEMIWTGYKMEKDGLSREEIELLNRVEPGVYRVTKADGSRIPFTITPRYNERQEVDRLMFHYPCKSTADRSNHLGMVTYLREILGELPNVLDLQAQIAALKAQIMDAAVQARVA